MENFESLYLGIITICAANPYNHRAGLLATVILFIRCHDNRDTTEYFIKVIGVLVYRANYCVEVGKNPA